MVGRYIVSGLWLLMLGAISVTTAAVYDLSKEGVEVKVECSPNGVDLGRDFEVVVTAAAPLPDLRDRFRGFSVAEDYAEEPVTDEQGKTTYRSRWRLVPEPGAEKYALRPFAVGTDGGSFFTRAVYFEGPAAREAVTGDMEIKPKKDLPPLSWKLVRWVAIALGVLTLLVLGIGWVIRKIVTAIKVHRMSPIQRAYYELDRLVARGLPRRGKYKDFYVELTLVVRRYIQRKYGIRAPNMTTEEFLRESRPSDELRCFLENADLVKFAGLEATPEMADAATDGARNYLKTDDAAKPAKPEMEVTK